MPLLTFFRPYRVVPTVNVSPEKVQQQLQLLKDSSGVYASSSSSNQHHEKNDVAIKSEINNLALSKTTSSGTRTMAPSIPPQTVAVQHAKGSISTSSRAMDIIDDHDDDFKSEFF